MGLTRIVSAAIGGSTVDGSTIGFTTRAAGYFTDLEGNTLEITGSTTIPTVASSDNSQAGATTAWVKLGFSILLAATGYIKFPTWLGGLVVQWLVGTTTVGANGDGNVTENWATAFPTACLFALPGVKVDSTPGGNAQGYAAYLVSVSTNSIVAYMDVGADGVGTVSHRMIALGVGY